MLCSVVAHEGMFLVGCCLWLQSVLIPTECFITDVSTAILQSFLHVVYALMKTAE